MRHCPNAECPHRVRFGVPSEFTDAVSACRDCGAALVEGDAPSAVERIGALPRAPLAITLASMVGSIAITRIPLPGVSPPRFAIGFDTSSLSIGMLGVLPFLSAALIVELVAVTVPRWRPLRTIGRRKLDLATSLLTLALAIFQSYGIVLYLTNAGFELTLAPPLLMLTLVAGVFGQLALARLVDRHGVGNGIATLIAAGVASSLFDTTKRAFASDLLDRPSAALLFAILAAVVVASARFVGRKVVSRGVTLRAPLSGIDPVVSASSLMILPVTLANLGVPIRVPLTAGTTTHTIVFFVLVLAMTIAFSFLFHRPKNVAEETGAGHAAILAARGRALRPTMVFVLAIAAAHAFVPPIGIVVSNIALLAVVALDAIEELDARRRAARWASIASLHRTYALDPLLDRLAAAKIEAIPRALRVRALFQFFAPWAPIEVLVPADDLERAHSLHFGGGPSRGQMHALGGSEAQLHPSPHETSPQASFCDASASATHFGPLSSRTHAVVQEISSPPSIAPS